MSKVEGPVGVPFVEENNFNQGRSADATTPKRMGPAVGHVMGNVTEGGGINRKTTPASNARGPLASGNKSYRG